MVLMLSILQNIRNIQRQGKNLPIYKTVLDFLFTYLLATIQRSLMRSFNSIPYPHSAHGQPGRRLFCIPSDDNDIPPVFKPVIHGRCRRIVVNAKGRSAKKRNCADLSVRWTSYNFKIECADLKNEEEPFCVLH